MRVSKSDGTQTLDLQRDALLAAGAAPERSYADRASGRKHDRPRKMTREALQMAMAALRDQTTSARTVAHRLGVTTTTLYMYVNRDGSLKQAGQAVLTA